MRKILFFCLFVLLFLNTFSYGEIVKTSEGIFVDDKEFSFSMTIPLGFKELPSNMCPSNWLYGFVEEVPSGGRSPITIGVESLGTVLNRPYIVDLEDVKKSSPPGTHVEKVAVNVLGFDIEGFRSLLVLNNVKNVAYAVQIPTKSEAIQLLLGGIVSRDMEIKGILDKVLSSLKAESNWFSEYESSVRLGRGIGIVISVFIGIAVIIFMRRKKQ